MGPTIMIPERQDRSRHGARLRRVGLGTLLATSVVLPATVILSPVALAQRVNAYDPRPSAPKSMQVLAQLAPAATVDPAPAPVTAAAPVQTGPVTVPMVVPPPTGKESTDPIKVLLEQAAYWRGQFQVARAIDSLNRILQLDPNNADALVLLVQAQAESGRQGDAQASLRRLAGTHPGDLRIAGLEQSVRIGQPDGAQLTEARTLAQQGKVAQSIAAYQKVFGGETPPQGLATEYYQTLGGTSGGFEKARAGLGRQVAASPGDMAAQLSYAEMLSYRETTRPEGIKRLTGLTRYPAVAERAEQSLRQALMWMPDDEASVPALTDYVAAHPADAEVKEKLETARKPPQMVIDPAAQARVSAYGELQNGKVAEAERGFQTALTMNADDADATAGLGLVRLRQGRVAEGRTLLSRALELGPSEAAGIEATLRSTAGQPAGEGSSRQDAAAAAASAIRARYAQVARLTGQARYDEAESLLRRIAGPRPDAGYHVQLGDIQARAGKLDLSEASFRRALAMKPGNSAALIGLAGIMLRQNRAGEAEALYAQVTDPAGLKAVGQARAEQLRVEARGIEDPVAQGGLYRTALAADPTNPWLRLEFARTLLRQRREADARAVMAGIGDGADPQGIEAGFYFAADTNDAARASRLAGRLPADKRTAAMASLQQRVVVRAEIAGAVGVEGRVGLRKRLLFLAAQPDPTGVRGEEIARTFLGLDDKAGVGDAIGVALAASRSPTIEQRIAYSGALLGAGLDADAAAVAQGVEASRLSPAQRKAARALADRVAASQADTLSREGRVAEAYDRLAPRLAADPANPVLNVALARLYRANGNYGHAVAITQTLIEQHPTDLDVRRAAVDAAIKVGDLERAATLAAEGVKDEPQDPRAFLTAAEVAKAQDEGTRALRDLRTARDLRLLQVGGLVGRDGGSLPSGSDGFLATGDVEPNGAGVEYASGLRPAGDGFAGRYDNPFRPGVAGGTSRLGPSPAPARLAAAEGSGPRTVGLAAGPPLLPGDAVTAAIRDPFAQSIDREIERLRDLYAPQVQAAIGYTGRSGESGLSRLNLVTAPIFASFSPDGIGRMRIMVTPTDLDGGTARNNSDGTLQRFGGNPLRTALGLSPVGAARQSQFGTAINVSYTYKDATLDVGTTPLGFRVVNVVGGLELAPEIAPDTRLRLTGERRGIINSALSYAGARDPVTGREWGGVVSNRGYAQLEWAPDRWFVYGGAGGGVVTGERVKDNGFVEAQVGTSYAVYRDGPQELRVGLAVPFYNFSQNQNFFTFGHGGYFSPQNYVALQVPVSWRDQPTERLSYKLAGALGVQTFAQKSAPVFTTEPLLQATLDQLALTNSGVLSRYTAQRNTSLAASASAEIEYKITPSFRVSARAAFQRAGDYTEGSAILTARYLFDEPGYAFR